MELYKKMFLFEGNVRNDHFGNVIVDQCYSDLGHLQDSVTNPETNKPTCRKVINRVFDDILGKHGVLTVTVSFVET